MKRAAITAILVTAITAASLSPAYALDHTVVSGDTLWILSNKYGVSINDIKLMNNMSTDMLNIGQKLKITYDYTIISGDTLWKIASKFKTTIDAIKAYNKLASDSLMIGQVLRIPPNTANIGLLTSTVTTTTGTVTSPAFSESATNLQPYVTYDTYYVRSGDNVWSIAVKFGVTVDEINAVNKFSASTILMINQAIKIPVHHIPVLPTPGDKYGELLDWWTSARYVLPIGKVFKIKDFNTGVSWNAKRTIGAFHADVEPLTAEDSKIMKSVWSGTWSWKTRSVIIEVDGRKIAASAAGMPHAGLDSEVPDKTIDNRSGDFGTGPNFDYIKDNEFDGHFDLHFLNSWRHKDGLIDPAHQASVHEAAGK